MLWTLINDIDSLYGTAGSICLLLACAAGFGGTVFALKKALLTLPKDQGRKHAINGELSKGKPRGGGVVFVIVFIAVSLLFLRVNAELAINYALVAAAMLTGYLDDSSKIPWGELKKGLLDLVICIIAVVTYCNFDGNYTLYFFDGAFIELPPVLYMLIAVFFLWVSINVTNCTDGVDGLLGTLSVITLFTLSRMIQDPAYSNVCLVFVAVLLGYLIFNAPPSVLLMGDAGSRAIGLFIGIAVLKTHIPLIYFLIGGVIFADGGIGLVKLLVIRIFKKKDFLKNIRTPLHDHFRKNKGWSDSQVDFRFAALHLVLCIIGTEISNIIFTGLSITDSNEFYRLFSLLYY